MTENLSSLSDADFFRRISDEVHKLFFPPAPKWNMAGLSKQINYAVNRQKVREEESAKEILKQYCELLRSKPCSIYCGVYFFRKDESAELPNEGAPWVWKVFTHPDTGEKVEGWMPYCSASVYHQAASIFDATEDMSEEWLPGCYLLVAMVHDWTDSNSERGRTRLLSGFDLPEWMVPGMNADSSFLRSIEGNYCHGAFQTSEEQRDKIERAMEDVKADLDQLSARQVLGQEHEAEGDMACADESLDADSTSALPARAWLSIDEIEKHIAAIAPSDHSILLLGETGTGKEYYARKIHDASSRSDKPFVPRNCAALPTDLITAELFGHKKGSYSGADHDREGAVRQAKGGTIFLDELGDLSRESQAVLLRFLQDKEIQPVGEDMPAKVDVRIIAATNNHKNLRHDIPDRFDCTLMLPPLRERCDIPTLALGFFGQAKAKVGNKKTLRFSELERELLAESEFEWPGNIRQLRRAITSAVIKHGPGRDLTAQEVLAEARATNYLV
jgi:transcriptional regulator with AAA-type ATPase domain